MARIILGSYLVRYPLGGMASWILQYLVGFAQLGHDVLFVEKSGYPNSCYDPVRDVMSDDCSYGVAAIGELLGRHGLGERWCYVDAKHRYHGMSAGRIQAEFDSADVFVDMGTHGAWLPEAARTGVRVMMDGEPGMRQMRMQDALDRGEVLDAYDLYYTNGTSLATGTSNSPTAGIEWRALFHPVATDLYPAMPAPPAGAAYTTVMNWQSYGLVHFRGQTYGHKDIEFEKFMSLPRLTPHPLEVAVSGAQTPRARLEGNGWRLRDAHKVTLNVDSFIEYVRASRAEFGVCKNGFVAMRTGWFSDRSAAYLSSGRPVVLQETGFSGHLPTGRGLFAASTAEEAAAAIDAIESRYEDHARWAREIAEEHLSTRRVLGRFLAELGLGGG
jgi:hypothetical protein